VVLSPVVLLFVLLGCKPKNEFQVAEEYTSRKGPITVTNLEAGGDAQQVNGATPNGVKNTKMVLASRTATLAGGTIDGRNVVWIKGGATFAFETPELSVGEQSFTGNVSCSVTYTAGSAIPHTWGVRQIDTVKVVGFESCSVWGEINSEDGKSGTVHFKGAFYPHEAGISVFAVVSITRGTGTIASGSGTAITIGSGSFENQFVVSTTGGEQLSGGTINATFRATSQGYSDNGEATGSFGGVQTQGEQVICDSGDMDSEIVQEAATENPIVEDSLEELISVILEQMPNESREAAIAFATSGGVGKGRLIAEMMRSIDMREVMRLYRSLPKEEQEKIRRIVIEYIQSLEPPFRQMAWAMMSPYIDG